MDAGRRARGMGGAGGLLDAYQAERQPITDQVSQFAFKMNERVSQQSREISTDIERQDEVGAAIHSDDRQEAYDLYIQQQCCGGLNFGYFYAGSPVIDYDGEVHPAYSMGHFTTSSVPGCRAPHFWLSDGRSLRRAGRWVCASALLEIVGECFGHRGRGGAAWLAFGSSRS